MGSHASLHAVIKRAHLRMAFMAISLAGVLLLLVGIAVLRLHLLNNLHLISRSLAYTVEASLVFEDRGEAIRVMDQLLKNEDVAYGEVFNAQGQVFVGWTSSQSSLHNIGESLAFVFSIKPVEAPIKQAGQQLGRVVLHSDGTGLVRFLGWGLLVLILCVGISGYLGMRQSRRMLTDIAEPLQEFARVARSARFERSMGLRVPSAKIAELNELGSDFNALLSELQKRENHLLQQNMELEHQATRDGLTGLVNRTYFEYRLQQALLDAKETNRQLAVFFLDNDQFKQVNDIHGHATGDELLKVVAKRLHSSVRSADQVARLGGDEFAILLYPVGDLADAQMVERKIQKTMRDSVVTTNGVVLFPSVSIGIAVFPRDGSTQEELMVFADQAMYKAKFLRRTRRAAVEE